ncbi:hypothetical protein DVS77_10935 [Mycolicibacterium moriokaense]|nr:hypothetical protein DVS77_10935 [Mycolicibacterium moriokaense]
MKALKAALAAAALTLAGAVSAPPADAEVPFPLGNYDVLTDRYTQASWVWFVAACIPEKSQDCRAISGIARLKFYFEYDAKAYVKDGTWSFTVDVPDGVRCFGYNLPSRDTYTWDGATLAGTIDSVYDQGCNNGPPGTQFWTFALQRL